MIQQPDCDDVGRSENCHDVSIFGNSHLFFPDKNYDVLVWLTMWTSVM